MEFTARSTVLTISGIAEQTAAVTLASSLLMIFSIRSVGNKSMSTELGFRRSVLIDVYSTLRNGNGHSRRRGIWMQWNRPSWPGGVVAAPKAQTGWWLKFDWQNLSIKNNHPGASRHPSWPGGAIDGQHS
jgi:hypothetical protein